jgi:hypothetical protein
VLLSCSCFKTPIRSFRPVQRLQLHRAPGAWHFRDSRRRRVMAAVQQESKQKPPGISSLAALDRSLSTAVFRSIGTQIPRPALMLFEHAGNGLFWIPGAQLPTLCGDHSMLQPRAVALILTA